MSSDVMIENFRPGTPKMGFGFDILKQINPKLIFSEFLVLAKQENTSQGPVLARWLSQCPVLLIRTVS